MSDLTASKFNPYEGQRTTPGPVNDPIYPVNLDIDLTSNNVYADGTPLDAITYLRKAAPIFWHPEDSPNEPGFWVLTRHEDIRQVSRNPKVFSSAIGAGAMISFERRRQLDEVSIKYSRATMVLMDPPGHTDHRALVTPFLTGSAGKKLEPVIRSTVSTVMDDLTPGEPFDLVSQFSKITPAVTLCHLLGAPLKDRQMIVEWSDALAGAGDPQYAATVDEVRKKVYAYGWKLLEEKKLEPGDDLLSAAISEYSRLGTPLQEGSMEGLFSLMIGAGHRTTRNSLTSGLIELYKHPEQVQALRQQPELITSTVEELLRLTTVVPLFRRTCTEDVEFHGQKVAQGEKVILWYTAANRDGSVFENPDICDITRKNSNKNLSFGFGTHVCVGNMLARLQLRIAIQAFVSRFTDMEVLEAPEYLRTNIAVSPTKVVVKTT